MAQIYDVREQLPSAHEEFYYCYSKVFKSYHIAKFNPSTGWLAITGVILRCITHWWDQAMPIPFEIGNCFDPEAAEEFKVYVPQATGFFGSAPTND
jgi:hypothetical protein